MLFVSFNSLRLKRLNGDQLKIVNYALAQDSRPMAPLVVYGAFGTGKTEALAETALMLASLPGNRTRVLVCTHTNAYVYIYFKSNQGVNPRLNAVRRRFPQAPTMEVNEYLTHSLTAARNRLWVVAPSMNTRIV